MNTLVKKTGALAVAAMLVVLMAAPLSASGAQVTKGSFEPFAAGSGDPNYGDVDGRARMIRTVSGKTIVEVTVSGLVPGSDLRASCPQSGVRQRGRRRALQLRVRRARRGAGRVGDMAGAVHGERCRSGRWMDCRWSHSWNDCRFGCDSRTGRGEDRLR